MYFRFTQSQRLKLIKEVIKNYKYNYKYCKLPKLRDDLAITLLLKISI